MKILNKLNLFLTTLVLTMCVMAMFDGVDLPASIAAIGWFLVVIHNIEKVLEGI